MISRRSTDTSADDNWLIQSSYIFFSADEKKLKSGTLLADKSVYADIFMFEIVNMHAHTHMDAGSSPFLYVQQVSLRLR